MRKHNNPRSSAITQRLIFNSWVRQPGKTVAEYVAKLRKLSEHSDFKDTLEAMKDVFIAELFGGTVLQ